MRRIFADELYNWMKKDKSIWLISCDLGYKLWDQIRDDFPDRFINVGAAEQAGMGIAVGLALQGKKPFIYSITTFLLYRPFETIRNYVDYEKIPVRLIGSGRDKDYTHDGISHWSEDVSYLFGHECSSDWGESGTCDGFFENIVDYWPDTKEEIPNLVKQMVESDKPQFISLKR